jgi:hypothetical protein
LATRPRSARTIQNLLVARKIQPRRLLHKTPSACSPC